MIDIVYCEEPGLQTFCKVMEITLGHLCDEDVSKEGHMMFGVPLDYSVKLYKKDLLSVLGREDRLESILPVGYKTRSLGIQSLEVHVDFLKKSVKIELNVTTEFMRYKEILSYISYFTDDSVIKYRRTANYFDDFMDSLYTVLGISGYKTYMFIHVNSVSVCDRVLGGRIVMHCLIKGTVLHIDVPKHITWYRVGFCGMYLYTNSAFDKLCEDSYMKHIKGDIYGELFN